MAPIAIAIFLTCGVSRSISDSSTTRTGFGSKPGLAEGAAGLVGFLSSLSATAAADVAQFRGLVAWTSRPTQLLPVIVCVLAAPAWAEGERALSVGLSWATFSVPGEPEGNMEPPAVTPDIGGALAGIYEHAIGSDFSLRAELAGALFYGGEKENAATMSYAGLVDAGAVYRFD